MGNDFRKVFTRFCKGFLQRWGTGKGEKEDYTSKIKQITGTAMESAKKSVACLNNNVNIILSCLEKIENLTEEELIILSDQFAGQFYHVDRKLAAMASKVGLKAHYRPEVGESLKLIKQIEDKATNFIKQYTKEKKLGHSIRGNSRNCQKIIRERNIRHGD